jgi:hypothetical protein
MPIFISYSHADREFVARLAGQLVRGKYKPLDPPPGIAAIKSNLAPPGGVAPRYRYQDLDGAVPASFFPITRPKGLCAERVQTWWRRGRERND